MKLVIVGVASAEPSFVCEDPLGHLYSPPNPQRTNGVPNTQTGDTDTPQVYVQAQFLSDTPRVGLQSWGPARGRHTVAGQALRQAEPTCYKHTVGQSTVCFMAQRFL